MAVNALAALRALARAEAQGTWNRIHREAGSVGLGAAGLGALALLVALVPPTVGAAVLGHALAGALELPESAVSAAQGLAAIHAVLVLGGGLLGGLGAVETRFLHDRMRLFPVATGTLLVAEMLLAVLDLGAALGIAGFLGLWVGMALALPQLLAVTAFIALHGAAGVLLGHQLAALLSRGVLRRPRLLPLVLLPGLLALGWLVSRPWEQAVALLTRGMAAAVGVLPTTPSYLGLLDLLEGRHGRGLLLQLPAPCFALAVGLLLRSLLAHEVAAGRGRGRAPGAAGERLWSFRTPVAGLARLYRMSALGTLRGRVTLLAPLILTASWAVLVSGLTRLAGDAALLSGPGQRILAVLAAAPVYAIVPPLTVAMCTDWWANQFGCDGRGIGTLLLLPVPTRDLLLGKLHGLAWMTGLAVALALAPLFAVRAPRPLELLLGLCAQGVAVFLLGGAGHLLSARFPSPIGGPGESRGPTPLARSLLPAGLVVLLVELLALTVWIGGRVHPAGEGAALLLLLALAAALYLRWLPRLERLVEGHKERLLAMLA